MTKELADTCGAVRAHVERTKMIEERLQEATQRRNELVGLEADAKSRLGQVEAESALESNPQRQADARKALLEIRDEIEVTEARMEGLRSVSMRHDGEFEHLKTELYRAKLQERNLALAPLAKEFRERVEGLAKVIMRLQAVEHYLDIRGPHTETAARAITQELRDLEDGTAIVHMRHAVGRFAWQDDPATAKTRDDLQLVRDAIQAVRQEGTAVDSRKLERRNAEQRAKRAEMAGAR